MTIGFERNGVKYLAASCADRGNNVYEKYLRSMKENYPVEKLAKFSHTAVTANKSTNDLYYVVNILEELEEEELTQIVLHDKVMPKLREKELKDRGVNDDIYIGSTIIILHNHRFYAMLPCGLVDVQDNLAMSNSYVKERIATEFIELNKDLDYKETILGLNEFFTKMNINSLLPFVVYKEDTDEIELVGERL